MSGAYYGSDVRVSLPEPPEDTDGAIPMFGFVMTKNGLFHDITASDKETLAVPRFKPEDPTVPIEWGDGGLSDNDVVEFL